MDFTGVQDIEYHGSAVQFGLPPRLSARYNTPEAWVLCLRAYLDGGPSDRPADWNWYRTLKCLPSRSKGLQ